ncbi:glycerophosphodiester phosphodiesterase [Aeromicrobium sp. Leaf350]|uniref:glycerophosphodiester phosphodiesterase n=1 Tax=Aeromicrobium sp. Leaf350 TaxID=2876565 RepID=UPI001E5ECE2C|nr:glycerophosphodiester phosphodiesterase [Aeromicrobium sp. Leaf350]
MSIREVAVPGPAVAAPSVRRVDVFAHRGASGYRPEHTIESYRLAIELGADIIEPDLVSTRDHVLVARHENEISGTTDVADRPEFADRHATKVVDDREVTGWFTEDFSLAELRTLRARERLPQVRPGNTLYDGLYQVPTFDEIVDLARSESFRTGRMISVAPETKHPSYFASIGLELTGPLVATLQRVGWTHRQAPVAIQSFEVGNLRDLATRVRVPLVQLTSASGAPYDLAASGDRRTYADLLSPSGLREIATYATWLGPEKSQVLPRDAAGAIGAPSTLVPQAHAAGLKVVVYTVRAEPQFLPTNTDVRGELDALIAAGVDGVFADQPDLAVASAERARAELGLLTLGAGRPRDLRVG